MLKIRIIAALIAIILTALTLYLGPLLFNAYAHWSGSLNAHQMQVLNLSQAVLGGGVAIGAFWRWRKRKAKKKV